MAFYRQIIAASLFLLLLLPGTARAEPLRLLMLGDSLTAGYGLKDLTLALPAQLQAALRTDGREITVLDGGVSGDTTAGGLARLDWTLGDKPQAVIVALGGNDGLRAIDPKATEANLVAILERLAQERIPTMLAGMLAPPNLGPEYGAAFNALYPRLAARFQVPLYPFLLEGVAAEPALNQADGIHPNADGVREIVRRLAPVVNAWLAKLSS